MESMTWVIDLDGVITSFPYFWAWWTYTLKKKNNKHKVYILTARNPNRERETVDELTDFNIKYDDVIFMMPDSDRSWVNQAKWKIKTVQAIQPDIWVDNDFKLWEREFKFNLNALLPNVKRVMI